MEPSAETHAPFRWGRHLLLNAFWLLVPILLLNLLCASRLPAGYQPPLFDADIPLYITLPEQLLRAVTFTLPCFVPLGLSTRDQRLGLGLFALGSTLYAASWAALIHAPTGAFATNAVGFLAPAYTPAVWLTGLVLLSQRVVIPGVPYRRWGYALVVALFLLAHNAHAALVYSRLP